MVDVPALGNLLLAAILVSASYTFAVSIAAARNRPHLLPASRAGVYATIALIASAVFLLAYAFQSHDFRIRYVERYSDRSMTAGYLWTALWGGQDGSLLWWCFLLSLYTLAFTVWIRDKYRELQPIAFATLASIFAFFAGLMLFAANPFGTAGATMSPADGEGLNPLLQNYWMAIHPPCLYMGLTGWSIPFAMCIAALWTGRLNDDWMIAARRWVLLAWGFLALGNMLGMFWSYEELGWGGYWAWDPVENAAFMPLLLGTAYVHSTMIQERRGMLRVWNVSLLCGTFFFTIFGTFLTRSGLIASVHSFARSDIGQYFAWYMLVLALFIITLIAWRLPDLRGRLIGIDDLIRPGGRGMPRIGMVLILPLIGYAKLIEMIRKPTPEPRAIGQIDSLLSREFMFVLNNWILTSMFVFVLVATTFPLISEVVRGETVTVGPAYYNRWMVPLALCLLFLMGVGPLIAWRKASGRNLREAYVRPAIFGLTIGVLHFMAGRAIGLPALVESTDIYGTTTGAVLVWLTRVEPLVCTTIGAFVIGTIVQEFARGTMARMRSAKEAPLTALVTMFSRARRRYGGYVVHLGVVLMFFGFLGAAYDIEREDTLSSGESMEVAGFTLTFQHARTEVDTSADMLYADLTVTSGGNTVAQVSPAKFVYRSHPEMPTTEVAIRSTPSSDLYTILSTVDPQTGRATFRVINRPLVWWIWFGGMIVLLGVFLAAAPSIRELLGDRVSTPVMRPGLAAAAVLLALAGAAGIALFASTASAQADGTSSLHAGTVEIHDPVERQLFERLLCECGDCQRLPLSTCGCSWAENMRAELRGQLASGMTVVQIQSTYRERFGAQAISVPSDEGLDRALWAAPLLAIGAAFVGLWVVAARWRDRGQEAAVARGDLAAAPRSELDDRLDDELRKLDE